ncbi:MAG: hypothetical protein LBL16_05325 [Endomicrobium sp.]|nr:hypothetical protein [Endomicrobium sp.]
MKCLLNLDEKRVFKEWFFDNAKWNKIYDFFEFCFLKIQDSKRESFTTELNSCLEKGNSGYRMNNGRVSQIIDEHEIEAIKESFNIGDTECGEKNI